MDSDIILLIDWLSKNMDNPEALRRFKDAVDFELNHVNSITGEKLAEV